MAEEKTNHPGVIIHWDEQSQGVSLHFDPKEFRSWDMVLNVLETAVRHAKDNRAMAIMQSMQQKQAEHVMVNRIRKGIGM